MYDCMLCIASGCRVPSTQAGRSKTAASRKKLMQVLQYRLLGEKESERERESDQQRLHVK